MQICRTKPLSRPRGGFSVIELLVVIAIIALMIAAAIPAINGIGRGQAMGQAISTLTSLLEYARTEAMARSTYVWVGFKNRTGSSGNAEIAVMAFASRDGTASAPANLIEPLGKISRIDGIQLTDRTQIHPDVQALLLSGATAALSTSSTPKTLPPMQGITFDKTITFAPGGEAMLDPQPSATTGFENVIDISLRPMRGASPDASSRDHAAIWLYGASGRLQIYRLQ